MFKTISEAHQALIEKKITPTELTTEAFHKAEKSSSNAFISLLKDQALFQASQIKKIHHYLTAIPYSLKDLFLTKGLRTTGASRHLLHYVAPYDGQVSELLKKEEAILIGKNNCDEFGMGSLNRHSAFGICTHAHSQDHYAGGSSGGSASSVLEGSSFFSIGTDTGGSIRLPAAFQGLWSLKPTYSRISRYGQIAYASSFDQAAPIARSPRDLAMILDVLSERDLRDSTMNSSKTNCLKALEEKRSRKIKLGYDPSFILKCSPLIQKQLSSFLREAEKKNIQLKEISFDTASYWGQVYYILVSAEASSNLARLDGLRYGGDFKDYDSLQDYILNQRELFGPEVKRRILEGTYFLHSSKKEAYFEKSLFLRQKITEEFLKHFECLDFIMIPTNAFVAPKLTDTLTPLQEHTLDLFTVGISLANLPALNIPLGLAEQNLSCGLQLVAPHFQEEQLLALGEEFYV